MLFVFHSMYVCVAVSKSLSFLLFPPISSYYSRLIEANSFGHEEKKEQIKSSFQLTASAEVLHPFHFFAISQT